jgi:hypothetical protein
MAAGSIVIDLLMRTGSFETDTDRARKKVQQLQKDVDVAAAAIGAAFAGASIAAAALVKSSIDSADALSDLSQSTGVSVEQLSALSYAADFSAVSQEALASSLVKLSKSMSDTARGTGDAEAAFKALGISVTNADGSLRDSEDVLGDLANEFAKYEDGAEKSALAVAVFGKAGADLIPFLNQGKAGIKELTDEAERLGIVISTETAEAAGRFNDTLARLQGVASGLANGVAQELLPMLNAVATQLLNTAEGAAALDKVARAAATGVKILATVGAVIGGAFNAAGTAIGGLAATVVQVLQGKFAQAVQTQGRAFVDFTDTLASTAATVATIWDDAGTAVVAKSEDSSDKLAAPVIKAAAKATKAARTAADEVEKTLSQLGRQVATFSMSDSEVKLFDLSAAGATPEQLKRASALTAELDRLAAAKKQQAALDEELRALTESTLTPFEQYTNQVERLNQLYADGSIDGQLYMRGISQAQDGFDKLAKKSKETSDTMSTFAEQAARNIQDSLAEFLFDPFDKGLDGMLEDFAKMLQRLAAQAAAAEILKSIGNWGSSNSGQEGWVGALAGMVSQFGGQRANGGPVSGGTTYLVGERGPELFRPTSSGAIVPNEALGGGGGDMVVNINNNTSAKVRTEERSQGNTKVLEVTIEEVVARSISQGGKVASAMQGTYQLNRGPGMPRRSA